MSADALVIGAGVAGISTAVHLADAGLRVTLLEQRKLLGGRAGSFENELGPRRLLDNSPHVLLGCCSELLELYRRLGVSHLIRFDDPVEFADIHGRRARMEPRTLPPPLHLGLTFAGFDLLTIGQRFQVARAICSMYFAGVTGREHREGMSFRDYLVSVGQSDETIRAYWDVIAINALNDTCDKASAKYGMQVFQEGLLSNSDAFSMGYPRTALAELYLSIPQVEVLRSSGVRSLIVEDGRVAGVMLTSGEALRAREIVLATDPGNALALLRPVMHLDPQVCRDREAAVSPDPWGPLSFMPAPRRSRTRSH